MKIPEHIACSFLLAQLGLQQEYGAPGTWLAIAAGCLPDLDGITIVGGWKYYRKHHRIFGHGLPMTLLGPLALAAVGRFVLNLDGFLFLWSWLQAALLIHLVTDTAFYDWPVQLLWPLSSRGWGAGLVAWNDLAPTLILYGGTALVVGLPSHALVLAAICLGTLFLYVVWRACRSAPRAGWSGWLAGGWARHSYRLCRWLTGDFVT